MAINKKKWGLWIAAIATAIVISIVIISVFNSKPRKNLDDSNWPEEGLFNFRHDLAPAEMRIQSAIYEASAEIEKCHQIELKRNDAKYPSGRFRIDLEFMVTEEGEFQDVAITFDDPDSAIQRLKDCIRGVVEPLRIAPVKAGLPKFDVFRLYFRGEE